uniref:Aminotransferase class I/classII large domain-containing protein n=1 Tax=Pygocentrus nattereri TaxID=42514 RepID=A0AAR2KNM7_PYGNA
MARQLHARRLEGVDKNIWVEFTQLTADYKAVNVGQGFPDFSPPSFIQEAFCSAITGGASMHQYTRGFGHPALVKILAKFFGRIVGRDIDPMEDFQITVGAYQALFCTFQALIDEGDEVIIVEPFFDCYQPMVKMAGGTPVYIPLKPRKSTGPALSSADWVLSPEELASNLNPRTKAIVINTPNNPLGKVSLELSVSRFNILFKGNLLNQVFSNCLKCQVKECVKYHLELATSLPGMWERTVTIGSAGKSFSATGWKVGWAMGPGNIIKHLKTIHQNSVYHCATAAQEAVAMGFQREYDTFGTEDSYFKQLPAQLHKKRLRLAECLRSVGLEPVMPQGGYFMITDISSLRKYYVDLNDPSTKDEPYDFRIVKWLIKEKGLATIPVSGFYSPEHRGNVQNYIRFCFVKEDSTLKAAEDIIRQWSVKK